VSSLVSDGRVRFCESGRDLGLGKHDEVKNVAGSKHWIFAAMGALAGLAVGTSAGVIHTSRTIAPDRPNADAFLAFHRNWAFSQTVGSSSMTPLERARLALAGPLGLQASETVYFATSVDSEGERISSRCRYRLRGTALDTRWWSITVYDDTTKDFIPGHDGKPMGKVGWNSTQVPQDEEGNWEIWLSGAPSAEPTWLPLHEHDEGYAEVLLRLYNPSDGLRAQLPQINLPRLDRISC